MIIFDSFWVSQNGWDVISMRVACHDILDVVSPIYCILLYIVNVFIYLYLFILWWKHMYRFPLDQYNVIVIQPELCYAGIWWSLHCNPTWTVPVYDGHYIVIQPEPCRYMMIITLYSNPNLSYDPPIRMYMIGGHPGKCMDNISYDVIMVRTSPEWITMLVKLL